MVNMSAHLKVRPICALLFLVSIYSSSAQNEGVPCKLENFATSGICKSIYTCQDPNPQSLPICSFDRNIPIVCCPKRNTQSRPNYYQTTSSPFQYRPTNRPQRPSNRPQNPANRPYNPSSRPSYVDRPSRPSAGAPRKSISELKCEEYARKVQRNVSAIILTAQPQELVVSVPKCDYSSLNLIVGGEKAQLGEFPHMVALGYGTGPTYNFNCGGSLISENFVMTAAHCTFTSDHGNPTVARLGELNLLSDYDGADPDTISIAEVIRHPDYHPPQKYHDIALIRLQDRVGFSKQVRPACLPSAKTILPKKAVATGWGRIAHAGDSSPDLLRVVLPLVENDDCSRLWRNIIKVSASTLPRGIDDQVMMCAGALEGGRDTCQGDSGGPLSMSRSDNLCIHYIIGVTSFGTHCGFRNSPAIYSRVSHYVPWIESIVWPNQ